MLKYVYSQLNKLVDVLRGINYSENNNNYKYNIYDTFLVC